ncbi:transmembrane protein 200A [Engraulis encrasicolus]|uniref:transmembrane protein 200A n=1 Tax=Engraulis encrasicolus TaxID=184585 RepID=UPI002FD17422
MITGGVAALAALKRQDSARSARSQHHLPVQTQQPPGSAEKKRAKRKPRADVVVVRGKLRLYSASGFFLLLGLLVLMAGIAMAVLGYWPHKDGGGGNGNLGRQQGIVLGAFLERHLHSEKMKMLGPFTMGIGIFIFICANAILHENRDRETKIIHMRDMYSTVIDIHSLRAKEHKLVNGRSLSSLSSAAAVYASGALYHADHDASRTYNHHLDNQYASRLAANTLLSLSGFGNDVRLSRRASSAEEEEGLLGEAKGLASSYRERSGSVFGLHAAEAGIGGGGGRPWDDHRSLKSKCQAGSIVSSSISAFTLPVIKLNNCVIDDEPDIESIAEEDPRESGQARSGYGYGSRLLHGGRHGGREPSMESIASLAVPAVSVDLAKAYKPPPPVPPPPIVTLLRSNSASESPLPPYCSSPSSTGSLSPMSTGGGGGGGSGASGRFLSPGAARRSDYFGSNSSIHMLSAHSKSLDLEPRGGGGGASARARALTVQPPEQRKHPSWPRLDRSNSKGGYMRLEDKEDPMDRLLVPPAGAGASSSSGAGGSAGKRDYTKKEKLLMISRSHNNLSFEQHDEFMSSSLKRGNSETRF